MIASWHRHRRRICRGGGEPQWSSPQPYRWDYTIFGKAGATPAPPDETMEFTIIKHNGALNGFNQWLLNKQAFSMETLKPVYTVHEGRRYDFAPSCWFFQTNVLARGVSRRERS